jgi:hypothetical protein
MFAAPTYFFLGMMATLLATAFGRSLLGSLPESADSFPLPETESIAGFALVFLILRAFASGGAAVTGVEAISNGVPAFRAPEWKNAITTLMWMGLLLGGMFLGLSVLAVHLQVVPDPHEEVTVVAQIASAVFGGSNLGEALYVMLQVATMLILVLAANTSFADFPRLASFHAGDRFLPSQLTRFGDRLVFSNGIIALAIAAAVLVIVFKASVTNLIPLYAIGVFTSFTFSQAGMAKHHLTQREPGWRRGLAINGFGALVTAIMTLIIAATKFVDGAYVILVAIPLMLFCLLKVNRHYEETAASMNAPERRGLVGDMPRQLVVIPVGKPGPDNLYATAYANRLYPQEVRILHVGKPGLSVDELTKNWSDLGEIVDARLGEHSTAREIRNYVRELRGRSDDDELINVVIPETVRHLGWRHLLRKWRVQRIKADLVGEADVVVTNVAHHSGYEELEPVALPPDKRRGLIDGWRHVAIVLVAGVNNATARSLRYGLSLRADELRCVHVAVDEQQAGTLRDEWNVWGPGPELEILESPYRQISRPIHRWVRAILEEKPQTFVTLVIPEFVVRKWWHRFLHNQTALTLKGTFLFEPSVVVSSVPYRL